MRERFYKDNRKTIQDGGRDCNSYVGHFLYGGDRFLLTKVTGLPCWEHPSLICRVIMGQQASTQVQMV